MSRAASSRCFRAPWLPLATPARTGGSRGWLESTTWTQYCECTTMGSALYARKAAPNLSPGVSHSLQHGQVTLLARLAACSGEDAQSEAQNTRAGGNRAGHTPCCAGSGTQCTASEQAEEGGLNSAETHRWSFHQELHSARAWCLAGVPAPSGVACQPAATTGGRAAAWATHLAETEQRRRVS